MKTVSFSNPIVVFKVLNHSDILIFSCFQRFKDTKKKANHNLTKVEDFAKEAVFNGSKILKRKLITTLPQVRERASVLFSTVQRY